MSIKVGTKVRVSREASDDIRAACKAAKKTYLLGVVLTHRDPCCGCHIVEFKKKLGGTYTFGTKGKPGYLAEVDPDYMTPPGGKAPKVDSRDAKVGDNVEWVGPSEGPAKKGAIAIVRVIDEDGEYGLEFIKGHKEGRGHNLDGKSRDGAGWWASRHDVEKVTDVADTFAIGDKVVVIETHDSARVGMKGVIVEVDLDKVSHPYGVRFPGWKSGHDLEGRLVGPERTQGQWVPASSLRMVASAPETLSKPAPKPDVVIESGFRVRVLHNVTTATGKNPLKKGTIWNADRISNYYGGTHFLIPFSPDDTLLVHESDIEVL